ncbi:hypothetical protein F5050DRAFT_1790668 [Lentinula boryana]|uniref:DUF6533 domain-containing protein n=1 Tax=Lentinula boryana TaxID=40481 RepID=A0ABQ8Q0S0_9AGAR|nr:hypothetical protein F5050DRAFT_1790668 [Lentinula boryana]
MAETNNLQFEIQYASIVLIWYDWILTLPMEVKYIWGRRSEYPPSFTSSVIMLSWGTSYISLLFLTC